MDSLPSRSPVGGARPLPPTPGPEPRHPLPPATPHPPPDQCDAPMRSSSAQALDRFDTDHNLNPSPSPHRPEPLSLSLPPLRSSAQRRALLPPPRGMPVSPALSGLVPAPDSSSPDHDHATIENAALLAPASPLSLSATTAAEQPSSPVSNSLLCPPSPDDRYISAEDLPTSSHEPKASLADPKTRGLDDSGLDDGELDTPPWRPSSAAPDATSPTTSGTAEPEPPVPTTTTAKSSTSSSTDCRKTARRVKSMPALAAAKVARRQFTMGAPPLPHHAQDDDPSEPSAPSSPTEPTAPSQNGSKLTGATAARLRRTLGLSQSGVKQPRSGTGIKLRSRLSPAPNKARPSGPQPTTVPSTQSLSISTAVPMPSNAPVVSSAPASGTATASTSTSTSSSSAAYTPSYGLGPPSDAHLSLTSSPLVSDTSVVPSRTQKPFADKAQLGAIADPMLPQSPANGSSESVLYEHRRIDSPSGIAGSLLRQLSLKRKSSLNRHTSAHRRGSSATATSSSTTSASDLTRRSSFRQSDGLAMPSVATAPSGSSGSAVPLASPASAATQASASRPNSGVPTSATLAPTDHGKQGPVIITPKPQRAQVAPVDDDDLDDPASPQVERLSLTDAPPPSASTDATHPPQARLSDSDPLPRHDHTSLPDPSTFPHPGEGDDASWAPSLPTVLSPRAPSAPPATSRTTRDDCLPPVPQLNASQGSEVDEADKAQRAFQQKRLKMLASLTELVDTERTYADDLAILVLVFFENLPRLTFFKAAADVTEQRLKLEIVYRNAEELLRLHQQLSVKLEKILTDNGIRDSKATAGRTKSRTGPPHRRTRSVGGQEDIVTEKRSSLELAMSTQLDRATTQVAEELIKVAPQLAMYKHYCARHAEALELVHEAERRQGDWAAYEDACSDLIRWQYEAAHKRAVASEQRRARAVVEDEVGNNMSVGSVDLPDSDVASPMAPTGSGSGNVTSNPVPASAGSKSESGEASHRGSDPAVPSVNARRPSHLSSSSGPSNAPPSAQPATVRSTPMLRFHDFFVKPVQRIMLYRLVLTTMLKHATSMPEAHAKLEEALAAVKVAADQVDEAGRQRERELLAEMLVLRLGPHPLLPHHLMRRMGPVVLAGPLQVFYHHATLAPPEAPVRFKYLSLVLLDGFLLMAKVRKSGTYDVRHFFPISLASVTTWPYVNDDLLKPHAPKSFRLSVYDHHYELMAFNPKERDLWLNTLNSQIELACNPNHPKKLQPKEWPCSLHNVHPEHLTQTSAPSGEASSIGQAKDSKPSDPLLALFNTALFTHAPPEHEPLTAPSSEQGVSLKPLPRPPNERTASAPTHGSFHSHQSGPSYGSISVDSLMKMSTPAQCGSIDKHMMMSASSVAVHTGPGRHSNNGSGSSFSSGSGVHLGVASPAQLLMGASTPTSTASALGVTARAAIGRSRLTANSVHPGAASGTSFGRIMGGGSSAGAGAGAGSAAVAASRMQRRKSAGESSLLNNPSTSKIRVLDIASSNPDHSSGSGAAADQSTHAAGEAASAPMLATNSLAGTGTSTTTGPTEDFAPGPQEPVESSWRTAFRRKHNKTPHGHHDLLGFQATVPTALTTNDRSASDSVVPHTAPEESSSSHTPRSFSSNMRQALGFRGNGLGSKPDLPAWPQGSTSTTSNQGTSVAFPSTTEDKPELIAGLKYSRKKTTSFGAFSSLALTAASRAKRSPEPPSASQFQSKERRPSGASEEDAKKASNPVRSMGNRLRPHKISAGQEHKPQSKGIPEGKEETPAATGFFRAKGYKVTPSVANKMVDPDEEVAESSATTQEHPTSPSQ